MKIIQCALLLSLFAAAAPLLAQEEGVVVDRKKHKVIFQLTSNDTLAQKSLVSNVQHLLTALPNARVEVVCHGNGITFLTSKQTQQAAAIQALHARGVDFAACENTMRLRKIKHEELVKECRTVPSGVAEVVLKEEKGWSYLKGGL